MIGFNQLQRIDRAKSEVDALGLRISRSRIAFGSEYGDVMALLPKSDQLPIYSRDAEIFVGNLDQLEQWLRGISWAREYDSMLKLSDNKKRKKAEDKEREKQRLEIERLAKRKTFAILADKDEKEVDDLVKVSK